jgi:hypothetical protein
MPLLGYVIIPISFPELDTNILFWVACAVTGAVLFFLGSIKSNFSWVALVNQCMMVDNRLCTNSFYQFYVNATVGPTGCTVAWKPYSLVEFVQLSLTSLVDV